MTAAATSIRYRFGDFELHPDERRLLNGGRDIRLGALAFDVLGVLVRGGGRLVTKDELLDEVWPRVVVEENTLQVHVSALRKAIGADAITTVSGRGYRFNVDVTEVAATSASSSPPSHNLPHPVTSFIGREAVLAELHQLCDRTRLLTLTGSGGCGKTRLAIQLARDLLPSYRDGVWIIELAPLADPNLVPQAVAGVFGLTDRPGKALMQTLIDHLASKHLLLILDNAEHVVAACARLADALLHGCAQLSMLVTSRERLAIAGELTSWVPSLSVPDAKEGERPEDIGTSESVRLFIERARLQRPHFAMTAENASSLGSICRRLDGVPLAIELAAPRIRSMSVEEVDRRLDQRFDLLTDGSRTALPRHRTLRSMIDWSHDLLDDTEKAMLRRVSVFAGGWTLDAAERVCRGDTVDAANALGLVTSLVDKSLAVTAERGGATRYGLLETVRHYARERLEAAGELERIRNAHLAHYVAVAEEAETNLRGAGQRTWLDRLEVEHDNVRSALAWCASGGDVESGLGLAGSIWMFWAAHGHITEGRALLAGLLAATPSSAATASRAKGLRAAGALAYRQGDYPAAQALHEEGLAIERELGDRLSISRSLNNLGNVAQSQGQLETASRLYEEALAIKRELGDLSSIALTLNNLGIIAKFRRDAPRARALYEEGLAIQRTLGNRAMASILLVNLGEVALQQGNFRAARAMYDESLAIERELENRYHIAALLEGFAVIALASNDAPGAARLCGRADRIREEIGVPVSPSERLDTYDSQVAAVRAAMGDDASFDRAWQEGRAMSLDATYAYVRDIKDV